jgi:hypothetical protein
VLRCHLSQSATHQNYALGTLLGRGSADSDDIGYFGVPCEILPHFTRTPINADLEWLLADRWMSATIPFQWIIQTRKWNEEERKGYLEPAPSEEGILDVARKAVCAVEGRVRQIEDERRKSGGDESEDCASLKE